MSLKGEKLLHHLQSKQSGRVSIATDLSLWINEEQISVEKIIDQMHKQSMHLRLNDIPKRNKLKCIMEEQYRR